MPFCLNVEMLHVMSSGRIDVGQYLDNMRLDQSACFFSVQRGYADILPEEERYVRGAWMMRNEEKVRSTV
jgi:hypothetical protein